MRYVCMMLACLLMVGCQEEEKWGIGNKTGFLVSLDDVSVEVTTRAASEEFNLVITKEGITEPFKKTTLTSGSSTFVEVSAGIYNIKATSTSWNEKTTVSTVPYYVAEEKDVEITESDTQKPIELKAEYGCALASVNFPEGLKDIFKEYEVAVKVGGNTAYLRTSNDRVYIKAGEEVTLSFGGTKLNGEEITPQPLTDEKLPSTFDAKDYYVITLMMGDGLTMDISKVEEKTVEITEDIPLDWLPKPKMEAEGFDGNNNLAFVETEAKPAKLNLNLSSALQDIKFKFDFQDEQFVSLQKEEYLLSNAEDKAAIEAALGVTLPNVGDETGAIDFSALVAKMQTNAGTPTINAVEVDVKANNRWSSEVKEGDEAPNLKYTFTCNKPEFSVAVQPGNCWSREFTVDEVQVLGNANVDKIKSNVIYQYYNGMDWVECTTRENVKGRTQQFSATAENIAEKTYKVRALYRGVIASTEAEAELETPEQLPNSGFEDWYEDDQAEHKNLWFPYLQGAVMPQWTTNNMETTHSSSDAWDSPSAVKRTTVINSGNYAAWIRTVGHGNTNTNVGSLFGVNGSITGTETIGILSYSDIWKVRPTQVSFNYRYIQKGDDAGVVEVKIENQEQNVVLFETSFTVQNTNYIKRDIPIEYSVSNVCATHLTLTFRSGSKHTEVVKAKVRGKNVDGNTADEHYGSEFYVDDISLTYGK